MYYIYKHMFVYILRTFKYLIQIFFDSNVQGYLIWCEYFSFPVAWKICMLVYSLHAPVPFVILSFKSTHSAETKAQNKSI